MLNGTAEIWHLAALDAVRGSASAFLFPTAQGLKPQTVPNDQLQEANALLRLTFAGTNIVGAALGGLLVAAVGPGWALGDRRRGDALLAVAVFVIPVAACLLVPDVRRLERTDLALDPA